MSQQGWTQPRIELLLHHLKLGTPYSRIAELLGVGVGAISGKVSRLPDELRPRKLGARPKRRVVAVERRAPPSLQREQLPPPQPIRIAERFAPVAGRKYVAFDDLLPHHCRWPTEVGSTHVYCGERRVVGLAYCPECASRSVPPGIALPSGPLMQIWEPELEDA